MLRLLLLLYLFRKEIWGIMKWCVKMALMVIYVISSISILIRIGWVPNLIITLPIIILICGAGGRILLGRPLGRVET